jgi:adenylate cyclase
VEKVVSANGGKVDKFMGDGVMALFGLEGHENDDGTDDAISAVNAAVNLKDCFQQIKSKWYKIWERKVSEKIDIGLKCGINTGEVIVAKVESEKSQYTAVGSVVNYASRFEGLAKDNQILMSQTTNSRVKGKFLTGLIHVEKLQHAKSFGGVTECYVTLGRFHHMTL